MEFRVLGPVEIHLGGSVLDTGHARQRAVLAVFLLDLGRVVPADRLIDRVWGENSPPAARNVLYGYIARLRALLASAADGQATLSRRHGGYLLQADAEKLDLHRFRGLLGQATAAANDEAAENLRREALSLWHGPALTGLDSPWLNAVRDALELERHAAQLDLNDNRLRQGQHAVLAAELVGQAAASPADERLIGQLMLALYQSGRQADALRQFDRTRRYLADELGTDPAPQLRELHQQILRADPGLASAPPTSSGRPAAHVPRELPADVTAFTGRAAELAKLDQILLGVPGQAGDAAATAAVISAVSGTAGVGKTALAMHWAHHAAARFPDGQLHINLRGYDPDRPVPAADALAAFLRSLGVPGEDIPQEEAERGARYRSMLASKQMLIVLDNAATVEQVRPLLPGHPGCRVVVTSRDSLAGLVARDGAKRLDLDLLPLDDAVALLRELIGARVGFEPSAAVALAGQCARLPLALRVAAELAAARPDTPLAELVAELRDQHRRLTMLDLGGDPHTAVRAVFSWSYRSLDNETARSFRLASLHPGPDFECHAVAALTGRTLSQTQQTLDALARAHLIQRTSWNRYEMHDLLRAYGNHVADHDDPDEQSGGLTRLLDYYLYTAGRAMDALHPAERHRRPVVDLPDTPVPPIADTASALTWLDAERPALVALTAYAAEHDWRNHAIRLAATLFRYLYLGSYITEAAAVHSYSLSAARLAGDHSAEGAALNGLASICVHQGRYEQAHAYLSEALSAFSQTADRIGQARSLDNLGVANGHLGRIKEAADLHRQALEIFHDIGDKYGECVSLGNLSSMTELLGNYQDATELYLRQLAISRQIKARNSEGMALLNLGEVSRRQAHYQLAASHLQQALAIFRELANREGQAAALIQLGATHLAQGDHTRAAASLQEGLSLCQESGDRITETTALNFLGEERLAAGRPSEARDRYLAALGLASSLGDKPEQARAHDGLGHTYRATGEASRAGEHWQRALETFTELGFPDADKVRRQLGILGDDES
jgi:DNA-binding SARP family transcriptional activator/Tfp pilus assembly protein PilF